MPKEPIKGAKAPSFSLPDQNGRTVTLADFKERWVVLYFYPKDDTPGCTMEAIDFTKELKGFEKMNAVVLGISPDSPESHCKFQEKHKLSVRLLSDESKKTLEAYGVWKEKSMYGRKYTGVERTTFLVDPQGKIAHIWNKVSVPGHIEEVKKKLKENALR